MPPTPAPATTRPNGQSLPACLYDRAHACVAWSRLTGREREVCICFARGMGVGATAEHLGMSRDTIETHSRHVRDKLGLSGKHQDLMMLTWRAGMMDVELGHA